MFFLGYSLRVTLVDTDFLRRDVDIGKVVKSLVSAPRDYYDFCFDAAYSEKQLLFMDMFLEALK